MNTPSLPLTAVVNCCEVPTVTPLLLDTTMLPTVQLSTSFLKNVPDDTPPNELESDAVPHNLSPIRKL